MGGTRTTLGKNPLAAALQSTASFPQRTVHTPLSEAALACTLKGFYPSLPPLTPTLRGAE